MAPLNPERFATVCEAERHEALAVSLREEGKEEAANRHERFAKLLRVEYESYFKERV